MSEPVSVVREIEKLLTQVVTVGLTLAAASLTRRGLYAHDPAAIAGGFAIAAVWALTIGYARWRLGKGAWWLLMSAPVVLALPVARIILWLI